MTSHNERSDITQNGNCFALSSNFSDIRYYFYCLMMSSHICDIRHSCNCLKCMMIYHTSWIGNCFIIPIANLWHHTTKWLYHRDITYLWQHTIQWYNDFVIFHAYVVSFTSSAIVFMSRDLPFVTTSCTFTFISWAMCPRKEKMTNPPKMLVTPSPIDTTIESLWGSEHRLIDWLIDLIDLIDFVYPLSDINYSL